MSTINRKDIQNIIRRLRRSLQLESDRSFLLEVNSSYELKICGIREVLTYDEANILVAAAEHLTQIKGENLMMNIFSDTVISVSGVIDSISFLRR